MQTDRLRLSQCRAQQPSYSNMLSAGAVLVCAEYCITEDYALSMELKAAGFKGAYMVSIWGQLPSGFMFQRSLEPRST